MKGWLRAVTTRQLFSLDVVIVGDAPVKHSASWAWEFFHNACRYPGSSMAAPATFSGADVDQEGLKLWV